MASGGEVEAFDLEVGGDAEGSGVDRPIVLGGMSMLPCIVRVVTRFGKEEGMRQLSGAVRTGRVVLSSSGGVSVRLSSTRSGACADVEVACGLLAKKEETSTVLSSPCGAARTKVMEAESSWVCSVESALWPATLHIGYEDGSDRMEPALSREAEN